MRLVLDLGLDLCLRLRAPSLWEAIFVGVFLLPWINWYIEGLDEQVLLWVAALYPGA